MQLAIVPAPGELVVPFKKKKQVDFFFFFPKQILKYLMTKELFLVIFFSWSLLQWCKKTASLYETEPVAGEHKL